MNKNQVKKFGKKRYFDLDFDDTISLKNFCSYEEDHDKKHECGFNWMDKLDQDNKYSKCKCIKKCSKCIPFEPANTLFVAKEWPKGANPCVYFTSIANALKRAEELKPTANNPLGISTFDGTYNEDLNILSNVHIIGTTTLGVIITGNIHWTPGSDINISQTNELEFIVLNNINITGNITINSTSKNNNISVAYIQNCRARKDELSLPISFITTSRSNGLDFIESFGCLYYADINVTNGNLEFESISFLDGSIIVHGNARFICNGYSINNTVSVIFNNTGETDLNYVHVKGNIIVDPMATLDGRSSIFDNNIIVNGKADLRNSQFDQANITINGQVDRTLDIIRNIKAAPNANTTGVIIKPYINNTYIPVFTQVGGDISAGVPVIISKQTNFLEFVVESTGDPPIYDITLHQM